MSFSFFNPDRVISFHRFFGVSLVVALLVPVVFFVGLMTVGMNMGIDFSGGTEVQVQFAKPVEMGQIRQVLQKGGFGKNQVQQYGPVENHEVLIRIERMDAAFEASVTQTLQKTLSALGQVEIRRADFVDGQVSKQLRTDGALAILYALIAILIYIALRFDVFFAPGAVLSLIQDVFGAMFVFVFFRYEFDLPSVAALLAILGCSINNTIIVYDRIREMLPKKKQHELSHEEAKALVNRAVNVTFARSVNTTLTTLFATVCLWILAGGVVKSFALTLSVGIFLGLFSSTFAAPAMYLWVRRNFGQTLMDLEDHSLSHITRAEKEKGVV